MATSGQATQSYQPTPGPHTEDPALLETVQWTQRELEKIGLQFTNHNLIQFNVLHVEPIRPREGMTVVADGVDWNPGSGAGQYTYINGAWVFSSGARTVLTADVEYFVRTDGNDSNTGLVDDSSGAFLTIERAIEVISSLDFGGNTVDLQISGPGTFTEDLVIADLVGTSDGVVNIFGSGTTPVIDGNIYCQNGSPWQWLFSDLKFQNSSGRDCFDIDGGWIYFGSVEWGSCPGKSHIVCHNGGQSWSNGNDTISGGGAAHWTSESRGIIRHRGQTITLTGTPNFTTAFAAGDCSGDMQIDGNTFVGSATGKRFFMQAGARLKTNTQDLTYLPGNAAGTFDSGFYEGIVGGCYPIMSAPTRLGTTATYTVGATDFFIVIDSTSDTVLTLPSPTTYAGRVLTVKNLQPHFVTSASSNVEPINNSAAGTAILTNTAGKFATMQADPSTGHWVVMAAN